MKFVGLWQDLGTINCPHRDPYKNNTHCSAINLSPSDELWSDVDDSLQDVPKKIFVFASSQVGLLSHQERRGSDRPNQTLGQCLVFCLSLCISLANIFSIRQVGFPYCRGRSAGISDPPHHGLTHQLNFPAVKFSRSTHSRHLPFPQLPVCTQPP